MSVSAAPSVTAASASRAVDVAVGGTLALGVAVASLFALRTLDPAFLDPRLGADVWFEGDLPRVVGEMTNRWALHSRATVHPLFALFACGSVYALRIFHLAPLAAVAGALAAGAGVWTALLFAALRAFGCRTIDSTLLTLLGIVSAAGLFWLATPETYIFGSATILAALLLAAVAERWMVRDGWFVAVSALSLSITLSNWMAGLAATFAHRPVRRALQVSVNAFALVVALWGVQRALVPYGNFFIGYTAEQRYLLRSEAGGFVSRARAYLVHSMVMPRIAEVRKPGRSMIMSVQAVPVARDPLGLIAVGCWLLLLGAGVRQWVAEAARPSARALGLLVAGQFGLYMLYGTETFLYALNFVPPLILVAAYALRRGSLSVVIRTVTAVLLVAAAAHNAAEWREARAFFERRPTASATVGAGAREPEPAPASGALRDTPLVGSSVPVPR